MMGTNTKSKNRPPANGSTDVDHQPLIDLFALLLEWDMKDVQEKEEKRKEVSKNIQYKGY